MNDGRGPLEATHFQTSSPIAEQGVHVSVFALGIVCLFISVSRTTGNSVQSLPGMDDAALRARWITAALAAPYASIDGVGESAALADVSTNRLGSKNDQGYFVDDFEGSNNFAANCTASIDDCTF